MEQQLLDVVGISDIKDQLGTNMANEEHLNSIGSWLKKNKRKIEGLATGGLSEVARTRAGKAVATGGISEIVRKHNKNVQRKKQNQQNQQQQDSSSDDSSYDDSQISDDSVMDTPDDYSQDGNLSTSDVDNMLQNGFAGQENLNADGSVPVKKSINWKLYGGIGAGLALVGGIIWYFKRKKKK